MKIGIDVHHLGLRSGGNETYVRNLMSGLSMMDREVNLHLFHGNSSVAADSSACFQGMRHHSMHFDSAMLRYGAWFPMSMRFQQLDIFHTSYFLPRWSSCPGVVTVHDVSYKSVPVFFTRRELVLFRLVDHALRHASMIITGSHTAKRDIVKHLGIAADRIRVVYHGVHPMFRVYADCTGEDEYKFRRDYRLWCPYVLSVGRLTQRKNLPRLIRAFGKVVRFCGPSMKLVVVGQGTGAFKRSLLRIIDSEGLSGLVELVGYVPPRHLVWLYRCADCMVFPSLYEGFGLPILEAMASNTPVIASRLDVFREIFQENVYYIDPYDVNDMAQGIINLWENPEKRACFARRGAAHARGFSTRKMAQETLAVYKQAMV